MRKNSLVIALLASLASTVLGACSIQDTPHAPTFVTDIEPIMLSRCVRCHGAGGVFHADPKSTLPAYRIAPFDGHFDRFEDDCTDAMPTGCHGLGHYVTDPRLSAYIHNRPVAAGIPAVVMPPAPAPQLTGQQLDIMDLWIANGGPED